MSNTKKADRKEFPYLKNYKGVGGEMVVVRLHPDGKTTFCGIVAVIGIEGYKQGEEVFKKTVFETKGNFRIKPSRVVLFLMPKCRYNNLNAPAVISQKPGDKFWTTLYKGEEKETGGIYMLRKANYYDPQPDRRFGYMDVVAPKEPLGKEEFVGIYDQYTPPPKLEVVKKGKKEGRNKKTD